ncbi:vesicle-associated membrane protein 722 [Physcomitrium patens]|uniref:Uncharacterized protein n=1 Tax=Physcomitrium patens TaxID=3218 RepID=A9SDL2_PHYPA|nr:vesicle-associated membrane protein 722-like [Physcomitrium patens]PNR36628.1 hypothetical protein PHYPA_022479 [Physcomitrium patens]|eukprot:XP_024401544.1 vesicle-associated membrane protein 722-like [Physcomitrella patens]
MGDARLIYSFVARGTTVLAEHAIYAGNFSQIAVQCLLKLPAGTSKQTYVMDRHTFNFFVENGFTFLVVAEEALGRLIPFAFLERVKDDFKHHYQGGRADLAVSHSLDAEFGPKLKEHMDFCMENPEEIKKISRIKSQVAEVKGIMMENIDKVLDRSDKIDLLVDRTTHLQSSAAEYQRAGVRIRRRLWWQHFRLKLLVLLLIVVVAFIIYLSICRGFICHNPAVPGTPPAPGTPPGPL